MNRVLIGEALSHLRVALVQSLASDDQIIIVHVREAVKALETAMESALDHDPNWCYSCDRPKHDCACRAEPDLEHIDPNLQLDGVIDIMVALKKSLALSKPPRAALSNPSTDATRGAKS